MSATPRPHKGMRFLHSKWRNSRFSVDEIKTLPHEQTALLFQVTAIRQGRVYYRPVYQHGDREELGGATYCTMDQFPTYCFKVTT